MALYTAEVRFRACSGGPVPLLLIHVTACAVVKQRHTFSVSIRCDGVRAHEVVSPAVAVANSACSFTTVCPCRLGSFLPELVTTLNAVLNNNEGSLAHCR